MSERINEVYLVLKAQAGNDKAFEALYRSYHASLLRFAYRLCRNEQLALDAVQDAWITTARTLGKLHDPAMFRARIFKAVRWRTIDYMRKPAHNLAAFDDNSLNGLSVENTQWATNSQIVALIEKLPDVERQAIYLFYLEDMKLAEIAEVLCVPQGTIKSRLNRARGRLKALIEGEEDGID